ncbi:hypothetical protein FRX31_027684 [Thalictrum thalictroides]|uniref:Uncharacterized protein n=1 Tax=Thalictrum thalictroides TaxID=46969 RepID=A0A7J6VCA2_THATH|nr:hypothetical protein FRX31_027684 [Thalictrum thalictroides]
MSDNKQEKMVLKWDGVKEGVEVISEPGTEHNVNEDENVHTGKEVIESDKTTDQDWQTPSPKHTANKQHDGSSRSVDVGEGLEANRNQYELLTREGNEMELQVTNTEQPDGKYITRVEENEVSSNSPSINPINTSRVGSEGHKGKRDVSPRPAKTIGTTSKAVGIGTSGTSKHSMSASTGTINTKKR